MDNGNELYDKEYLEFYDCNKLAKMIKIYLSLIKTMQLELGDINSIKITPSYELKYSDFVKPTNSGIESFWINDYENEIKLKECISKYTIAFNLLCPVEKEIFRKTFVEKEKDSNIELSSFYRDTYQRDIRYIRKSAIVKFSSYLKFNRLMDKIL